jgi:hypothetical protein
MSVAAVTDTDYLDTPETAPPTPRTQAAIDAAKVRELRNSVEYKRLKANFRAEGARERQKDGTFGAPCWLCDNSIGPIGYNLDYPHPLSWSLDHALTVKERPDLIMDPLNFRHSHHDCNQRRGSDDPAIDLGEPSEVW